MTSDLYAMPNRTDGPVEHFHLSWPEEMSMWAFVERSEQELPLLANLYRSAYGPEHKLDASGEDALLRELAALETNVQEFACHSEASRLLQAFLSNWKEQYPHAKVPTLSVDAALQGTRRMAEFVENSRAKGWLVYNSTD